MTPLPGLDPSTTGDGSLADLIPGMMDRLAQITAPFGHILTDSAQPVSSAATTPPNPFANIVTARAPTSSASPIGDKVPTASASDPFAAVGATPVTQAQATPSTAPAAAPAALRSQAPASSTSVALPIGNTGDASPPANPFAGIGRDYHQQADPTYRPTGDATLDQAAHALAPTQQRGIVARLGSALLDQEAANIAFAKAVLLGGGPMNPVGVGAVYQSLDTQGKAQFQNGAAFTASTVASMLAPEMLAARLRIPGASTLVGKALAFEATQAAGGATFGALQHLEPGQTRTGAIAGQAAGQMVLGTLAGGVGLGLSGALAKMGLMGSAVEKAVAQTPVTDLMTPEVKAEAVKVAATPAPTTRTGTTGTVTRMDELLPLGAPGRETFPTNLEKVPDAQLLRGLYQRYDQLPERFGTVWARYDDDIAMRRSSSGGGLSGAIIRQMQGYIGKIENELTRRGITPEQLDSGYNDWLENSRAKGPPAPEAPATTTAGPTGSVTMTPGSSAAPMGPMATLEQLAASPRPLGAPAQQSRLEEFDAAARAQNARLAASGVLPKDVAGALIRSDNLAFDTPKQAANAVLQHEDWASRWEASGADAQTIGQWRASTLAKAGVPPAVPPPPVPPSGADVPHAWGGDGNTPTDSPLRALRVKLASLRDNQLAGLSTVVDAAPIIAKAPHLLARTILGATGAGTMGYAQSSDDLDPGTRALLTGVGGLLLGASFVGSPTLKAAAQRIGLLRNTVGAIDGSALLTGGSKEAVQSAVEISNLGERAGQSFREAVDGLIPDKALNRAARYVLDEPNGPESGIFANHPELMPHLKELQKLFQGYKTLLQNTTRLDGTPLLTEAQENYLPRSGVVPTQELTRFAIGGAGGGSRSVGLSSTAGILQQRTFDTLRELETHLRANGLEPNDLSLGQLVGHYIGTAQKLLASNAIKTELARIGLLLPGPETISTAAVAAQLQFENGVPWRTVNVSGAGGMIAPETIANALEGMSKAGASQWSGYLGDVKGLSMRAIMLNPAIHSINALRGALAAGVSPSGAVQAWRAIANNDPRILEAASHGLMTSGRPDLLTTSEKASKAFEAVVSSIPGGPVLRSLVNAGGRAMAWGDHLLWERIVPTLGQAVYDLRLSRWADQTGGKFGVGSPEYVQAARGAAQFANDQMGKIPDMLQSGEFQRLARNVLFAPKWLQTRMRLSAGAMGELTDVLTGELSPRNAAYLQAKVRQAVIGVGGTYLLSKALTGQAPEFNERNSKFYAKTGISNGRGSDFGVDMLGWYQDDSRLFNAPFQYAAGKLNPLLRVTGETISGRDWAGRSMTGAERVENAINGLGGPVGQAVTMGARALSGGEANVRSGLDATSALTGAGTFAAMPRAFDVTIGNVAKRLLQQSAVPASDDRIFELSRILRQNAYRGRGLVDKSALEYLAYQRRTAEEQRPLSTLFERGKQALRALAPH